MNSDVPELELEFDDDLDFELDEDDPAAEVELLEMRVRAARDAGA